MPNWSAYVNIRLYTDSACVLLAYQNAYLAGSTPSIAPPYANAMGIVDWDVISTARR